MHIKNSCLLSATCWPVTSCSPPNGNLPNHFLDVCHTDEAAAQLRVWCEFGVFILSCWLRLYGAISFSFTDVLHFYCWYQCWYSMGSNKALSTLITPRYVLEKKSREKNDLWRWSITPLSVAAEVSHFSITNPVTNPKSADNYLIDLLQIISSLSMPCFTSLRFNLNSCAVYRNVTSSEHTTGLLIWGTI